LNGIDLRKIKIKAVRGKVIGGRLKARGNVASQKAVRRSGLILSIQQCPPNEVRGKSDAPIAPA
jgi:hypothetical protein